MHILYRPNYSNVIVHLVRWNKKTHFCSTMLSVSFLSNLQLNFNKYYRRIAFSVFVNSFFIPSPMYVFYQLGIISDTQLYLCSILTSKDVFKWKSTIHFDYAVRICSIHCVFFYLLVKEAAIILKRHCLSVKTKKIIFGKGFPCLG